MAEKHKARYISDEELTILAKFLTQQEMSTRTNLSQQRISQRLAKIKKQKAVDKTKKEPTMINPQKMSVADLIKLSYDLLISEKDKSDVPANIKVAIARELTRVASAQSATRNQVILELGMQKICNRLEELLKEADPTIAQKIAKLIIEDKELNWLITGKEPSVLIEETTKKEKKEEKDPTARFDVDLL